MTDEPGKDTAQTEPPAIERFRGQGWMNIWGVLLLLFFSCVGVCLYVLATAGLSGAIESKLFGYAAFVGALLGIWLIGRRTVPYLLTQASSGDAQTIRHAQNRGNDLPGTF